MAWNACLGPISKISRDMPLLLLHVHVHVFHLGIYTMLAMLGLGMTPDVLKMRMPFLQWHRRHANSDMQPNCTFGKHVPPLQCYIVSTFFQHLKQLISRIPTEVILKLWQTPPFSLVDSSQHKGWCNWTITVTVPCWVLVMAPRNGASPWIWMLVMATGANLWG